LEKQVSTPTYDIVLLKVISPLASPSSLKCEEGKRFMEEINEIVRCANDIEETTKPLLERLRKGIFKRPIRVAMGFGIITQKPMEIQKSNNKNEQGANAI
jgi:hypothetical protein